MHNAASRTRITFTPGARYLVDGEHAHNPKVCTVLSVADPDELPAIGGAPPVDEVRSILSEFGVHQVLVLSFESGKKNVFIFVALVCQDGAIRDMAAHLLDVAPIQ